jgi:hypothetical protein
MMATPDQLVADHGRDVTHEYVTAYDLDSNGQVDPSTLTTQEQTISAIVSNPTEEDEQRVDGRLSTGARRLTVDSGLDVKADRPGRRDRITIDGELYKVVDVSDDIHPITGTQKLTVVLDRLGGYHE